MGISTVWKNLLERRRKRAEREKRAKAMRRTASLIAKIEPAVWRSLQRHALKAGKRVRFPRAIVRASGAVQVGEGVWVAGIHRELAW